MFYPTTCVGFRYGPRSVRTPGADFLGSLLLHRCRSARGPCVLSGLGRRVSATAYCLPPFNAPFRRCAGVSLLRLRSGSLNKGCGILTACPSTRPFRGGVRSRLTLIRLALIRNPWSFGEGVSRSLYRYLYLHLLFRGLQRASRRVFDGVRNAPLPCLVTSIASVNGLCPIIIHARFLD